MSNKDSETMNTYSQTELEEKLARLQEARKVMVEKANREIAQLDGAIAFLVQLLAGELDKESDN